MNSNIVRININYYIEFSKITIKINNIKNNLQINNFKTRKILINKKVLFVGIFKNINEHNQINFINFYN